MIGKQWKRGKWMVRCTHADGSHGYLTPCLMPDGERDWGDLPEAATFGSLDLAREYSEEYGGKPVPA